MASDHTKNPFGFGKDELVFEPDNTDSVRLGELAFPAIVYGGMIGIMPCPVQFDCELLGWAVKIKDVLADTVLAPKFPAIQSRILYKIPESGLCRCKVVPQYPAKALRTRK